MSSIKHHNSNSLSVEFQSKLTSEYKSEKDELLDTFAAKHVGRGIWNMFMTLVFMLKFGLPDGHSALECVSLIHYNFLHYCRDIYCLVCRVHAAKFISNHKITEKLYELNREIEDEDEKNSLIIYEYFNWFYTFRNSANSFANKQGPEFNDVIRFFSGEESSINNEDFTYDKIHVGIWHCFFILITRCYNKDHVKATYFLIGNYMKFLPTLQKNLYLEFKARNNFLELISDEELTSEELCVDLFDWTYALYNFINSNSEMKVFSKDAVSDAYYNMAFCSSSCGT